MFLYIDPGTGSMLFTILIGVIGAAIYFFRNLFMKFKFFISGGKVEKNVNKIPYVIYSDHKRYWNVFEPICDEFERREIPLVFYTSSEDDPALKKEYKYVKCEFIGEGNKGFAKLNMLNACIVLSTTPGLDVYQWKRSKDVNYYVHIPHAVGDLTLYRCFGLDYYDAVLTSGDYQINQLRNLEKLRNLPAKDMVNVGLAYMDVNKARLNGLEPLPESDNVTVLVAPSWGKSAILSKFGEKFIDAVLKTGYKVIVRPHPQSFTSEKDMIEGLMNKYPQVEWNRDNDNFEVLRKSDIMISDFSGVIFDYFLIFDKPVMFADTSFDKAPYDAWWLDEPLWSFSILPKIGMQLKEEDFDKMKAVIDECLNSAELMKNRKQISDECWTHKGEGAVKTVDYLVNKYEELNEKEAA